MRLRRHKPQPTRSKTRPKQTATRLRRPRASNHRGWYTYRYDGRKLAKFIGGVRVGEASPARLDAALRSMRTAHGPTMARRARTLLRGALQLVVLNNVLDTNPVRDVQSIESKAAPKGAIALTADELRELLAKLRASETCQRRDLVDPITLFIATGLRHSELLALRCADFDADAGTVAVTGKVVRQRGVGPVRVDETKTAAGRRTIPLPAFAVAALTERRTRPFVGEQRVIFASTAGTLRNPTTSPVPGVPPAMNSACPMSARTVSARP